ncbi:MAG TPA: hypothetical protein VF785_18425 [Gemmatimonadaceae bacterium]
MPSVATIVLADELQHRFFEGVSDRQQIANVASTAPDLSGDRADRDVETLGFPASADLAEMNRLRPR